MAVLKKFRSRWWSPSDVEPEGEKKEKTPTPSWGTSYDIRPLTISQLDDAGGSISVASSTAKRTAARRSTIF
jgi:hypothetical protein